MYIHIWKADSLINSSYRVFIHSIPTNLYCGEFVLQKNGVIGRLLDGVDASWD